MSRPINKVLKGERLNFQQRLHDGYVCLDPFIPLLTNLSNFQFHHDDPLFENLDDMITAQFNILIDTDRSGKKWITSQKAHELWDLLHIEEEGSQPENLTDEDNNDQKGEEEHRGKHDLVDASESPSKRHQNSSVSEIPVFMHDLPTSATLQKALPPLSTYSHEERIKLETLLQKILFPEPKGIGHPDEYPVIDLAQHVRELDEHFPNVPLNLNIPIDEHGNTSLHWLCSIANLSLLKQLISFGSNRRIGDKSGESALVKAVKSVNNYDSGTFETLLDYLHPCIVLVDEMDRTVLHHIVLTSGMAGCNAAAKYYLDILMGWIVKKQKRLPAKTSSPLDEIDLHWVIKHLLNARDSNGDTCLNIAARLGNVAIVEALMDYGANPNISNNSGLRPTDFGAGTQPRSHSSTIDALKTPTKVSEVMPDPIAESSSLISNIQSLLSTISQDYDEEVKQHNDKMKELHEELTRKREALAKARDRLARTKHLQDEYHLLTDRLSNVENTILDEDQNFQLASRELGLSLDDVQAEGLNSGDIVFDADEPFRIAFVNAKFEEKLKDEYNNDFELFVRRCNLQQLVHELQSSIPKDAEIPNPKILKARLKAYNRNEAHLESTLQKIKTKQRNLESKFRKVLSLCLKIDEEKVDSMLDGLLQAISTEDPEDVDTDEIHDFLENHVE